MQVIASTPHESRNTYNTIHVALLNRNVQNTLYEECRGQYNEKVKIIFDKTSELDKSAKTKAGRNIVLHHQAAVANILRLLPLSWIVDKQCFDDKTRAGFSVTEEQEEVITRALQLGSLRESAVRFLQRYVHLSVAGDCHQYVSTTNKLRLVRALDQW